MGKRVCEEHHGHICILLLIAVSLPQLSPKRWCNYQETKFY